MNPASPEFRARANQSRKHFHIRSLGGGHDDNALAREIPGVVECSRIAKIVRRKKLCRITQPLPVPEHTLPTDVFLRVNAEPHACAHRNRRALCRDSFRLQINQLPCLSSPLRQQVFRPSDMCGDGHFLPVRIAKNFRTTPRAVHLNQQSSRCKQSAKRKPPRGPSPSPYKEDAEIHECRAASDPPRSRSPAVKRCKDAARKGRCGPKQRGASTRQAGGPRNRAGFRFHGYPAMDRRMFIAGDEKQLPDGRSGGTDRPYAPPQLCIPT